MRLQDNEQPVAVPVKVIKRIPIGIDLDSTIANFPKAAIELFKGLDENAELAAWTTKRVDRCFGKEADRLLQEAMSGTEFWENLQPLHGVIKELVKLMPKYYIHVISQRHERIRDLTHDWLCLNEIPFDTVDVVSSRDDKLPLAREYGCLGFIDDDDDVCRQMVDAGLVVGQVIWPWNKPYKDLIRLPEWNSLAYAVDLKLQDRAKGR